MGPQHSLQPCPREHVDSRPPCTIVTPLRNLPVIYAVSPYFAKVDCGEPYRSPRSPTMVEDPTAAQARAYGAWFQTCRGAHGWAVELGLVDEALSDIQLVSSWSQSGATPTFAPSR